MQMEEYVRAYGWMRQFWAVFSITIVMCLMQQAYAEEAAGPPPAPVVVAVAEQRSLAPVSWVPGTVQSRSDAQVATEVDGRIQTIAEIGQNVVKGDVIAGLINSQIQHQLDEYQANVIRAEARLKFLVQEVKRLRRLAHQNNAARTQLDQTEAEQDVAKAELAFSRAQLAQMKDLNERRQVRAPFDGMVVEQLRQPGEWVKEGDVLVRLVDTQHLEIKAMVPLSAKQFLAVNSQLTLRAAEQTVTGRVRSLVSAGDPRSRLLDMRVDFEQHDWVSGLAVRVAIPSAAPRNVIAVPRDALVLRRSGTSIYKINGENRAERVDVVTGIAEGSFVEVSGNVQVGDQVIIRGSERLRPGQAVKPVNDGAGL